MAVILRDHPLPRLALGSLDPNWNMNNTRPLKRRPPITLDQENEDAVADGVASGIYDIREVVALTRHHGFTRAATPNEPLDSDEEGLAESPSGRDQILQDQSSSDDESSGDRVNEDDYEMISTEVMEGELVEEEVDQHEEDDEEAITDEQVPIMFFDPAAMGLKEINNLAHFGVSSHKPGNGVDELLSEDLDKYWQ